MSAAMNAAVRISRMIQSSLLARSRVASIPAGVDHMPPPFGEHRPPLRAHWVWIVMRADVGPLGPEKIDLVMGLPPLLRELTFAALELRPCRVVGKDRDAVVELAPA